MNTLCFRLVFNRHRGRLVAVSEICSGEQSRGSSSRRQGVKPDRHFTNWVKLSPIVVSLGLAFPFMVNAHNIVADRQAPGTQQPIVLKAANGVPVIQIQTPNDKGVSINHYQHLDVDRQGAIFNNSQKAVQSQLGGWIQANPWLLGKEARLIVNQINSRDPSHLQRYLEVAGRTADMVIANPAGIQVDGVGFINIPNITITTGLPQYQNGALTGFAVRGGQITVFGQGIDATKTSATQLFAQALELTGGVFAKKLQVVAGANDVTVDGQASPITTTAIPSVAIDTKALGGMYANAIYLRVTDKGAGVNNAGQWFAGAGGLTLDAQGNLNNSGSIVVSDEKTTSRDQSTLTVKAQGIHNTGSLSGEGRTQVSSQSLSNEGLLSSTSELILKNDTMLHNQGDINATRLAITTNTLTNQQGQIVQSGPMVLAVETGRLSQSQGSHLGGLEPSSSTSTPDTGHDTPTGTEPTKPPSDGGVIITTPPTTAQGGGRTPVRGETSSVLVTELPNGKIQVHQLLENTGGKIIANGTTTLMSQGQVDNVSSTLLVNQLNINSEGLTNREGKILADQVSIKGEAFVNELGHVSVHGDLNAHLTQMFKNLQGRVETLGNLTLSDNNTRALTLTNTGELYSAQNTVMLGKRFENTGGVQSDNDVTLTASTLTQSGTLLAGHDLTIEGEKLKNTGVIQTGHDLTLSLENDYRVSVPLKAGHDLTLNTAGNVYTYSSLEAGHDIGVQTHRMKVEAEGQVSAGNNVELHVTNGLSNRGLINSQGLTPIDAGTQVFNVGTGRIYGDHVAIKTTDLMNREETVNGTTTAASIVARDRLDIAAAKVVNREHALLASEGELYIGRHMNAAHWASGQADKVDNGSATIESGANMTIEAKRLRNLNLHFKSEVQEVPGSRKEHVKEYLRDEEHDMTYYSREDITDTGKRGVIYFKGRRTEDYWLMDFTYHETQPYVLESDPGIIRAGGQLTLKTEEAINNKSHILSNDEITVEGAAVTNIDATGEHREIRKGRRNYHYIHYKRGRKKGKWTGWESYRRADVVTPITLDVFQYRPHDTTRVTVAGAPVPTIERVEVNGQEVRRISTITNLPNQSLYRINKTNPNAPLLETDPAYTNYRQWLGSDYMLRALGQDPAQMHKRLGDGYVEQRLVREQIAQLTGRVRLSGYATEEAQFQSLLEAGITLAERFHLTPGVSLSPEMVAELTSDIVWLEDETVTLPDGTTERVLVPKVYVVVRLGDLDGTGSLIAADNLHLNLTHQLVNQGTLSGRRVVQINANTIQNLGRIDGGDVALRTKGDLENLGGTIRGEGVVSLQAGRDLRNESSLYHTDDRDGVNTTSRTDIERVAGIYATGPQAKVVLEAARDAKLTASRVGSDGELIISAGRDVQVGSVNTAVDERSVVNEWDQIQRRRTAEVGSELMAKGDLMLESGRDTTVRSSVLKAAGSAMIDASRDVRIEAGQSTSLDKVASTQKAHGLLKSSEKRHSYEVETAQALSSVINGKTVSITSGADVNVVGSRVISEDRTDIAAAGTINVKASENRRLESEERHEKQSGLTASLRHGVASIGYGRQTLDAKAQRQASSLTQSEVGSLEGDTVVQGNQGVTVKGSTLASGGALTVHGATIHIENGEATQQESSSVKTSQSGFSLGVTYSKGAAMKGAIEKQWKDDGSAQLGWVGQSVKAGYAFAEGMMASQTPVVVTLGHQQRSAQHQAEGQTVVASEVSANGALQLIAHEGDIHIVGSRVSSEGEAILAAKENLHMGAAHQNHHEKAREKRSGFSLDDRNWVAPVGTFNEQLQEQASVNQAVGSELSFGDKAQLLAETGDIRVEGSSIVAEQDLTLHSGRDVVIERATSSESHRTQEQGRGIGAMQVSDTERFVGYMTSKQDSLTTASTLKRSQVGSLTGNVTIDAKGEYRQKVADVIAGQDLTIIANAIQVEADHQTQSQDSSASDSKVGVFAKVSSPLIDLAQTAESALKSKADDRTKALQTLATGAQGYITYDSVAKGNVAKGEVGLGVRTSKQKAQSEQRVSQGNLLRAGDSIQLTTREGDVVLTHTTVEAGGDVHIDSARDIVLKAGETTQTGKGSNKNAGVGVGVGVSVGAQTGLYAYAEASIGSGTQSLERNTYELSSVQGKTVTLNSERDTTLKGAQVRGEKVDVKTGGTLAIESLQDHVDQKLSQTGMGARVQVSLGTAWDASGNVSQSEAKGKLDAVNQQSGVFAGQGGYHVKADKVSLVGGAIVSSATQDHNELTTNQLDFKHLENHSEYEAYSANLAASYGDQDKATSGKSLDSDKSGRFDMTPTLPVKNSGQDSTTTYATISPGRIVIPGKEISLNTLGIHTDATTAHSSVEELPDLEKLSEKQRIISEAAGTIVSATNRYIENKRIQAYEKLESLRKQFEEELKRKDPEQFIQYLSVSEDERDKVLMLANPDYFMTKRELQNWGLNGEKSLFFKTTTGIITGVLSGQQNAQISTNAIAPYATRLIGDWFQGPEKYKLASKLLAHSLVAATIAYVNESDPKIGVGASLASLLVYRRLVEVYNDGHTAIDPITKTFNPNLLPEDIKKELVSIVNVLTVVASSGLTQTKLDDAQLSSVISENITINNELAKHTKRVWTNWDMIKEYLFGNKKIVTLEEMGLSDSVLQLIKKDSAFGLEGSIESRFLKGISNGETAFIGSYDVGGELLFSMGGGIISGTFEGEILQLEGGKKLIKGEITYLYTDVFKDALNILNSHNYIYRKEKYRNNKITDKEIKKRISDHIEAIQNGDTKNIIKYYNNDKMIDLDVPGSNKYIIVQKWKTKVERNI